MIGLGCIAVAFCAWLHASPLQMANAVGDTLQVDSLQAASLSGRLDSLDAAEQDLELRLAEVEAQIAALNRELDLARSATLRFQRSDAPILVMACLVLWLAIRYLRRHA